MSNHEPAIHRHPVWDRNSDGSEAQKLSGQCSGSERSTDNVKSFAKTAISLAGAEMRQVSPHIGSFSGRRLLSGNTPLNARNFVMADFEKVEREGKVAVLYSPGYGAGWYSWNSEHEGLLFDREIVEAVERGAIEEAVAIAERKYPEIYTGGSDGLTVTWVPKGDRFEIHEYDGSESVRIFGPDDGHVA